MLRGDKEQRYCASFNIPFPPLESKTSFSYRRIPPDFISMGQVDKQGSPSLPNCLCILALESHHHLDVWFCRDGPRFQNCPVSVNKGEPRRPKANSLFLYGRFALCVVIASSTPCLRIAPCREGSL